MISQIHDIDTCVNQYTINRKCPTSHNVSFQPLSALTSLMWKSLFLDFSKVLKTESYLDLCHSTLASDKHTRSAEYFECFGDQVGILLLRNILDELALLPSSMESSPSEEAPNKILSETEKHNAYY